MLALLVKTTVPGPLVVRLPEPLMAPLRVKLSPEATAMLGVLPVLNWILLFMVSVVTEAPISARVALLFKMI